MVSFFYIIAKGLKKILNPPALKHCQIHETAKVCSRSELTNVELGKYSYVGNSCFIVKTKIGNFCSIADNVVIGSAEHPMNRVSMSPVFHAGRNVLRKHFADFKAIDSPTTYVGNDVWIGNGAKIKAGVVIGDGSIVGMGSVVTHDIPPYAIVAGSPARLLRYRFSQDIIAGLVESEWWTWPEERIQEMACWFDDPRVFLTIVNGEG